MPIYIRQNNPEALNYLAAQRQLYNEAKQLVFWSIFFSGVLIAASGYVALLAPKYKFATLLFSIIWDIYSIFWVRSHVNDKIRDAATIQEMFDTKLFGMHWNRVLVGEKLTDYEINEASGRYGDNRASLHDWYPNTDRFRRPLDILFCQKLALERHWRLRELCGVLFGGITTLYLLSGIIMALQWDVRLTNFVDIFLLPSVPIILFGLENAKAQFEIASSRWTMEPVLNDMWDVFRFNPSDSNIEECRQVQDFVFLQRNKPALIPNLFYDLSKHFSKPVEQRYDRWISVRKSI